MKIFDLKFQLLIILLVVLINNKYLHACTSFAVYCPGDQIYYGMNFDYSEVEMRFSITDYDSVSSFHLEFFTNGYWSSTVGMNSNGFFSSCQMLYPEVSNWHYPATNEMTIGQLYYYSLLYSDNTNSIVDYFDTSNTQIIHNYGITLHNLFADKYGNAITIEVGDSCPLVTTLQDNFLVMTNFPNSEYIGQSYTNVEGVGSERYKKAYEYISNNINDFDYNDGIETLQQTIQSSGGYPTQCSFLFDPVNLEIYVIIKRDFNKIWKVDLENKTIETFLGFDFYKILNIGSNGILISELENITNIADNFINLQNKCVVKISPNPFNDFVNINFNINSTKFLVLEIYNTMGQRIETLEDDYVKNGYYNYIWYPNKNKNGIYIIKFLIDNILIHKKIIFE